MNTHNMYFHGEVRKYLSVKKNCALSRAMILLVWAVSFEYFNPCHAE